MQGRRSLLCLKTLCKKIKTMQKMTVTRDVVPPNNLEQGTPSETIITGFSKEFKFFSVECPDRRLETRPSLKQYGNTAIPTGEYKARLENHPKFGYSFFLQQVPNFEGVYFPHIANSKEDLKGCLGIGEKPTELTTEKGNKVYWLYNSRATKDKFNTYIKELIGRGELKIGDKIKIEIKRKEVINN